MAHSRLFVVDNVTYEYWYEEDVEDDNVKKWHNIRSFGNKHEAIMFDWSPYSVPDQQDLVMFVQLGCPRRIGYGPIDREDLLTLLEAHIAKQIVT